MTHHDSPTVETRDRAVQTNDSATSARAPAQSLLDYFQRLQLVSSNEVEQFLHKHPDLRTQDKGEEVGRAMVQEGLLTQYQLDRVLAGTSYGLTVGNYCVVDRLGAGGMGIVFKARHVF